MGDVAAAITDDGNSNPYSKWKTRASTAKERKKIIQEKKVRGQLPQKIPGSSSCIEHSPIGNRENDDDDDDDGPKIVPNFPQSASYQSSAPQNKGQFSMP